MTEPQEEDEARRLAAGLWSTARDHEQGVVRIRDDALADRVRAEVRRLAAAADVRIRTARLDGTVVAVRLDAAVWQEDAATMRRRLSPPD